MLVDDGLESWNRLTLYSMVNYWNAMQRGDADIAWQRPPTFEEAYGPVTQLMLETVSGRAYRLASYKDLSRLMLRDGYLKLVFESGREEIILAAYQLRRPATALMVLPEGASKVLPFKRP